MSVLTGVPEEVRKIGELTVKIDRLLCVGFGDCIDIAPELFEFDDDDIAVFREGSEDTKRDQVMEACQVCPVDALTIFDEAGNQFVP